MRNLKGGRSGGLAVLRQKGQGPVRTWRQRQARRRCRELMPEGRYGCQRGAGGTKHVPLIQD